MDKETLSNYGWIVICVLVLAVMLALASPFGKFVSGAVQSTTQGLFDVNQSALGAAGIDIMEQEFEEMLNGSENNSSYEYIYLVLDETAPVITLEPFGGFAGGEFPGYAYYPGEQFPELQEGQMDFIVTKENAYINLGVEAGLTEKMWFLFDVFDDVKEQYTVSSTVAGMPVYGIIENAFRDNTTVKSIVLENGIQMIGGQSFWGCTNLTSISIPETVTEIMPQAFKECSRLTSITLPKSLETIENCVFDGCSNLTSITYNGTIAEWNAVAKKSLGGQDWDYNTGNYTIHCTDGDIPKS